MFHAVLRFAALACALAAPVHAQDFVEFSSKGRPGSEGIEVRVSHPARWRRVPVDDPGALAELRGPQGTLTGILQIGRGRKQADIEAACQPERAQTMLQNPRPEESDARITDVFARTLEGRPAFEVRYERPTAPEFLLVRSVIVCLKDTRLVVSCGAAGASRSALEAIEPVCRQVLESVRVTEE
jgi:hypothetical protein